MSHAVPHRKEHFNRFLNNSNTPPEEIQHVSEFELGPASGSDYSFPLSLTHASNVYALQEEVRKYKLVDVFPPLNSHLTPSWPHTYYSAVQVSVTDIDTHQAGCVKKESVLILKRVTNTFSLIFMASHCNCIVIMSF